MESFVDPVTSRRHPPRWRARLVGLAAGALLAIVPGLASAQGQQEPPKAPGVTAGGDGFVIQSGTGDYRLQIGLLLQVDGRFALDDEDAGVVNTFALRRIRPYLRGRLAQRFEFFVNPDFANGTLVLQDAYIDTRFSPAFIVRLGKGKTPFGLERLVPASSLLFFERALPTALVPNRDVGIQVLGDLPGGVISYSVAALNGVPDGGSADVDTNDGKDLAGRIAIRPFGAPSKKPLSGLTLAIAGTTGDQSGPLATIRTASLFQNFVTYTGATADGRLNRYSPQASYYFRRAAGLAEYVHTRVPVRKGSVRQEIAHDGWQIAGAFVLTSGDTATERGVRPQHNFDFDHGHLGALQVGARYHTLTVDEDAITLGLAAADSSHEAKAWTVGLNWYLNPNLKYVVNFERTQFDGNDAAARHAENALAFRAQVYF
jgi:phosphate-selective porin OprO/OprP